MIIDKSVGYWFEYVDDLTDIAYYLYVKDWNNWIHSKDIKEPITQYLFIMQHSYEKNNIYINRYFNQALNIIRKEKLKMIVNGTKN